MENALIRTVNNHQIQAALFVSLDIHQIKMECVQGLIQIALNLSTIDAKHVCLAIILISMGNA